MQEQSNWKTKMTIPPMEGGSAGELIQCTLTQDTIVMLCDYRSTRIPDLHLAESLQSEPGFLVSINYCFRGRAEARLKSGEYAYLSNGEISVDAGSCSLKPEELFFPAADYHGILVLMRTHEEPSLGFQLAGSTIAAPNILRDKVHEFGKPCISETSEETRLCFETMRYDILNDCQIEFLMLDLIRLLLHINEVFPGREPQRKYFSKSQVQIAKAVRDALTADLGKRYSAAALAKQFGISETSLKNYFRGVYGCGYSEFQSEVRMKRATELLARQQLSIASISEQVGFSNQSSFTRAFREYHGVTPVEYRRQLRIKNSGTAEGRDEHKGFGED